MVLFLTTGIANIVFSWVMVLHAYSLLWISCFFVSFLLSPSRSRWFQVIPDGSSLFQVVPACFLACCSSFLILVCMYAHQGVTLPLNCTCCTFSLFLCSLFPLHTYFPLGYDFMLYYVKNTSCHWVYPFFFLVMGFICLIVSCRLWAVFT